MLPAACRKAMNLAADEGLIIRAIGEEATLFSVKHAIENAQALVHCSRCSTKRKGHEVVGRELTQSLMSDFVEFDVEQAYFAAQLRTKTRDLCLSFGDTACLGLAQKLRLPVLTADRAWKQLKVSVEIRLIC